MGFVIFVLLLAGIGILAAVASEPPSPPTLPPPSQRWVPPQFPPPPSPRSLAAQRRIPAVFRKCQAAHALQPGPCHICGQPMLAGEDHSHR